MGSHGHHVEINLDERYSFSPELKKKLTLGLIIGAVFVVIGVLSLAMGWGEGGHDAHGVAAAHGTEAVAGGHGDHTAAVAEGKAEGHGDHAGAAGHHEEFKWTTRLLADLWHNSVFFTGISVIGLFWVAVQYCAWAGWSAGIKRIPEAFGAFLPIGAACIAIIFAFGHHDMFHWTHDYLYDPKSPQFDKILASKQWWLNMPFYIGRTVLFLGLWMLIWRVMRNFSLKEDQVGGTEYYNKSIWWGAIFIIIFAVSSSVLAWDWTMSIDSHWYSTMFGWYHFASWWVSGIATITLITILLKEQGYLSFINENHLHDLGKFMFAFSIFWTYLWFSQFMLIYYANISEETVYFSTRLTGYDGKYSFLFYFNIFINFIFPFLFLMTRASKRLVVFLKIAAIGILIGHWLDFYLMMMPGITKGHSGFGFLEFGLLLVFLCTFIWVIAATIAKAPLVAKNHPMLEESIHHEVI